MKPCGIRIRKGKINDSQDVFELIIKSKLLDPNGNPPKNWWIEAFIIENQIFYIAEREEKIIGFIFGERTTGDIAILWMIWVEKKSQNKGVGSKLLIEFENDCKARGLKTIVSYGKNSKISYLFEKFGFAKGDKYNEFEKFI